MKILRLEWSAQHLACARPYRIAYESVAHADNVFVQLVTDGAAVGLGCATPDAAVTGETLEACTGALRRSAEILAGCDPLRRVAVMSRIAPALEGTPAAAAAIDMALHDLLGKVAGLQVATLLGGHRLEMPTSVTLGIDALDATVAEARQRAGEGFMALKIKGGLDVTHDVRVVKAVREAVGPAIELRFDANQGYDAQTALRFLAAIESADLAIIEQPTAPGALREVTRRSTMPVMADESLVDLGDALHLAAGERVDMVNIKLMKVGGIDAALAVNAVAQSAGIEAMVGCMDESALAIAAGLHLALARSNITRADLDGHLDLVADPAAHAVELVRGCLRPVAAPGLGLARLTCFE